VTKGLREDLPDNMVKNADADDRTPTETVLNALGQGMVAKDAGPDTSAEGVGDLSWTREDIEQVKMSGEEKRLALLEEDIREAHRKVENGRVRDAENEKVRQGWIRALAYAANSYRQLKRDEDLED